MVSMSTHNEEAWLKTANLLEKSLSRTLVRLDYVKSMRSIMKFQKLRGQFRESVVPALITLNRDEVGCLSAR
jgi:hypothetical protein